MPKKNNPPNQSEATENKTPEVIDPATSGMSQCQNKAFAEERVELAENTRDYHELIESIDQGFCVIEVLFDVENQPYDYRIVRTNRAFERQTGLRNAVGKTILELAPDNETIWIQIYGEIASSGHSRNFEEFASQLLGGSWYSVYAFRMGEPGQNLVAILFNDITREKKLWFRQEFLNELSKLLVSTLTASEMMEAAANLTAKFLRVSVCDFVDVRQESNEVIINHSWAEGRIINDKRTLPLSQYFSEEFILDSRLGKTTLMTNSRPAEKAKIGEVYGIKCKTIVTIPFHRYDEWVGYLIVISSEAQDWDKDILELLHEVSERVFPRVERLRIMEDLRLSEEKYRMLFNSMDQGFCIIELMYGTGGRVNDWRYVEVNPAFEKNNGLHDVIGKTITQLRPDLESKWFELYEKLDLTGDPVRLQEYSQAFNRWFDVFAFRIGNPEEHRISVFFTDITERKTHEAQQAFLSEITKNLVELDNIDQTMRILGEKVARHFNVSWCHFAEVNEDLEIINVDYGWNVEKVTSIKGVHHIKNLWSPEQILKNNAGETTVVNDTRNDPRVSKEGYDALNIRSFISVPLARNHRFKFMIGIADEEPRVWTTSEVQLIKELTSRIWARLEKARAEDRLRRSRSQLTKELSDTKKLQQISTRIIAGGNLKSLYETILELVMDIMGADAASIHLLDNSGTELSLEAQLNIPSGSITDWRRITRENTTSCSMAFQKWERVIIPDIENQLVQLNKADYDNYHSADIRAVQSTPMANRKGKKMGIISTFWKRPHSPSEHNLNLFDAVVRQVADLIESREAEELLRESEERMRIIFDAALDFSIVYTDTEGIIKDWNSGAELIFEYKPEEIIGKPLRTIFNPHERERGKAEEEMNIALNEGLASYERWYERRDGSKIFLSGVLRPVYNPQFSGFVKITRDMTDRKLLERQKDDFISIASHELKTPVTSIKAYTELIKDIMDQTVTDPDTYNLMVKLDRQVDRMIKLIHTLLDVAIISRGKFTLYPSSFDLNELVQERVEDIRITASGHQINFVADEKLIINADRERIGEVLNNLLSNAIKYSAQGTHIQVKLKKVSNGVEVSVKDNGFGISEENQKKLFERFYRIQNEKKKPVHGLGLGLYISAAIIFQHQGKIWLESKLHKGSTFYFFLPFT